MKLHLPGLARRKGETAENHRTRLLETAPHMARTWHRKTPGFFDARKVAATGEPSKTGWPKVGKRHDD